MKSFILCAIALASIVWAEPNGWKKYSEERPPLDRQVCLFFQEDGQSWCNITSHLDSIRYARSFFDAEVYWIELPEKFNKTKDEACPESWW